MACGKACATQARIKSTFTVDYTYTVYFETNIFDVSNSTLKNVVSSSVPNTPPRVLVVTDAALHKSDPALKSKIENYFTHCGIKCKLLKTSGSEKVKDGMEPLVQKVISAAHSFAIDRQNYIMAVGGGALVDAVGFAASIFHRGARFIRIPTTTLSQCDAAVGVKNGIDYRNQKNLLGVFDPPWAVVNDFEFLKSLPYDHWIEGYAEAVKVTSIKDVKTYNWLLKNASLFSARDENAMQKLIKVSAKFHMQHIAERGDPFERTSARPLDLGHWSAHKLEEMSGFKLTHGTAVAIGLLIDFKYAACKRFIKDSDFDAIRVAFETVGFLKNFESFSLLLKKQKEIIGGLDAFRQHLGGELTLTFPAPIGSAVEVHEVDADLIASCMTEIMNCISASSSRRR